MDKEPASEQERPEAPADQPAPCFLPVVWQQSLPTVLTTGTTVSAQAELQSNWSSLTDQLQQVERALAESDWSEATIEQRTQAIQQRQRLWHRQQQQRRLYQAATLAAAAAVLIALPWAWQWNRASQPVTPTSTLTERDWLALGVWPDQLIAPIAQLEAEMTPMLASDLPAAVVPLEPEFEQLAFAVQKLESEWASDWE